jgi:hypothetical protein
MNYTVLSQLEPSPKFLPNHQTADNDKEKSCSEILELLYTVLFCASCRIRGRTKFCRWRQWAFSL